MKRAIIPAAGFGTRMHMHPGQSKEMLIDPVTQQPLIQWHLNYCTKYNLTPLIITRKEKIDLIEYCNKLNVETLIIEPKGEWMSTIEASRPYWEEMNVVLFPDSKFSDDEKKMNEFFQSLDFKFIECCFGVQEVEDSSKWCVVTEEGVFEKTKQGPGTAIVVFGFKKKTNLFLELSQNKTAYIKYYHIFNIHNYVDLTRTGTIEKIYV